METCNDSGTGFVFLQDCGHNQLCDAGACVDAPTGGGGGGGGDCGPVTPRGCCDGSTLRNCEGGQLKSWDCGEYCGWDPEAIAYGCGFQGADPTGKNPPDCP